MNKCLQCGKECNIKFCNRSCSASYNNNQRKLHAKPHIVRYKSVQCKVCKQTITVNIFSDSTQCYCKACRDITYKCKCCGIVRCKNKICKWFRSGGEKTSAKLGIKFTKQGTHGIFEEIAKVKALYQDMYFNKEMSLPEIQKETGIFIRSIQIAFNIFDLKLRNLSKSTTLARIKNPEVFVGSIAKTQSHTTWDGKEVTLRSNNELAIAKELDAEKIEYRVEPFRIPYVDTEGFERFYIPDFYVPSKNLIIEAKGSYFMDNNCKLKANAARNMGYNYKFVLDFKETQI